MHLNWLQLKGNEMHCHGTRHSDCCCVYLLHCSLHHIPQFLSLRVLTLDFASSFNCHLQNITKRVWLLRREDQKLPSKNRKLGWNHNCTLICHHQRGAIMCLVMNQLVDSLWSDRHTKHGMIFRFRWYKPWLSRLTEWPVITSVGHSRIGLVIWSHADDQ